MFIVLQLQAVSNPMWWGEEMGNSFLFSFCFSQLLAPDISVFTSSQECEDIRTDQSWQDMGGWGTREQEENYKRPMSGAESADCSTTLHWEGNSELVNIKDHIYRMVKAQVQQYLTKPNHCIWPIRAHYTFVSTNEQFAPNEDNLAMI